MFLVSGFLHLAVFCYFIFSCSTSLSFLSE
nr:MAG TPA: beta-catenin [Caudoviricetes sp.]